MRSVQPLLRPLFSIILWRGWFFSKIQADKAPAVSALKRFVAAENKIETEGRAGGRGSELIGRIAKFTSRPGMRSSQGTRSRSSIQRLSGKAQGSNPSCGRAVEACGG